MPIIFSLLSFLSTLAGGLFGIKFRDKKHLILGFTAGVLLALVAFDIFPEIFRLLNSTGLDIMWVMVSFTTAFIFFHILEKVIMMHYAQEDAYHEHKHPTVGIVSSIALIGHSFLDGVGIGLAFQVSNNVGIIVAVAVIAHDFSDGLNTASIMLMNANSKKKTFIFVILDSLAPIFGVLISMVFIFPESWLLIYLGFFAGFLLYLSAADILPEAHREKSSYATLFMTLVGVMFIFLVTRFV